jgi:phosphoesterase RecJ-like protein
VNADGDGAGSQVAVASWLRALGAQAWIVNPTPFPDMFRFMVPDSSWIVHAGSSRAKEICAQADLAVVLDTGEVHRIGRVKGLIDDRTTVIVDHHPPGDRPLGGISFRDPSASATGEMVYDLMQLSGGPWPMEALIGLYVAILTDTGNFRFSNSTPGAHRVVADLIERGVDPEEMYEHVYGASPIRRFRLLEAALATLDSDEDHGVAWMQVPRKAYVDLGAEPDDLEGLVDYPRSVDGVEVGLLFRQTEKGDTKVSFRSNGEVDVNALARRFDGGGHVKASGALLKGPPEKVVTRVVDATREAVRLTREASKQEPLPPEDVLE